MPARAGEGSLTGISVVEAGDRIAVSLCGALLAALGAEVAVLAPATPGRGKWSNPALA
jgi:crotonobetainyl-CoA:carnitine CoA-transferase CaiB-like acyl-CoA transferase